jgi:tRNA threonylcarbamoyladenosine biosynthesis protein TsaE
VGTRVWPLCGPSPQRADATQSVAPGRCHAERGNEIHSNLPGKHPLSVTRTIDLSSLAATEAFGRRLGSLLFPGTVVALIGPLGAGKTHLVRAVAEGLGVTDARVVTSPTFVLIQEYEGRLPIYHFDAYRLRGAGDLIDLGVHEYFEGDGVCLVEWADRAQEILPQEHLRLELVVVSETARRAVLKGVGGRYEALIRALTY